MQDNRDLWVGIDHGTCNSAAVCDGQIIQYQHGCPTIPTIVRYNEGQFSLADGPADPGDFDMKFYKRVLGRFKHDGGLDQDLDIVPFAKRNPHGSGVILQIDKECFHPEEASAFVIGSFLRATQISFPSCQKAVIAVPAHFSKTQIRATKDAAYMAGASEVKTIPEPVAAVLHLLHTASAVDSEFILVVDGGAGTWDLSAVTVGRANGKQRFTVKATAGNNHLGGLDVDQALRDIVLKRAGRRVSTPSSLSNLLSKCEGAKIRMSQQALAEPSIPVICDDGTRVVVKLTHEDFDQACSVLRHGVEDLFKEIFRRDATMMERIETIALNGGSSYLPCIRALCQSYLPNIPIIQRDGDTAVAFGASLFGSDSAIEVMDVLPKSIGVLTRDDKTDKLQVCIIARRNMQLPIHCSKRLFTPKENCGKVKFSLVESESSDPKQSTLIGVFSIDISACGETTDIDTTIDITMDNIVHGRAVIDGHEGELTITCPEKFTPDRRQAMQKTT